MMELEKGELAVKRKTASAIVLTPLIIGMLTLVSNAHAAEPVYFSETGHYYEAIAIPGEYEGICTISGGITWNDAKSLVESLSYLGVQGHLATITSKAENDFIINNLGGPATLNRYWLGGFQPPGSPEPDGNWQWVTGEPWNYTNWAPGEPNNCYGGEAGGAPAGSNEEALLFWAYTGQWNDMEESSYHPGLIVEYDIPPPLSASISPLSASILAGQSVTFTSTISGGYTSYSYQWYLGGNPVSGATSASWTFTSTASGIYYIYLKVTDAKGNTAQSETARITVTAVPVGGYSIPIEKHTTKPLTPYITLLAILTMGFTTIKRKTTRKTK